MPAKHVYRFEVEVTHIGSKQDFEYFFAERRQKADVQSKLLSHQAIPLTPDESQPKLDERLARSFFKKALTKAGYQIIKSTDLFKPTTPKNGVTLVKDGESFRARPASNFTDFILKYFKNHASFDVTIHETYQTPSGKTGTHSYKETDTLDINDVNNVEKLAEVIKKKFQKG